MKNYKRIIVIIICVIFLSIITISFALKDENVKSNSFGSLLENLPLYSDQTLSCESGEIAGIDRYLDFYNLRFENVKHDFFKFKSGQYELAGHIYHPEKAEEIVILLHGYLNHVHQMRNLIAYLTENGYAVGCYDLPGHGLSGGNRGDIENFEQYATSLEDFISIVDNSYAKISVVGFSTGGATVIQYLLNNGRGRDFNKILLMAPLVRTYSWNASKFGEAIAGLFVDSYPNLYVKNCSNQQYLDFVKNEDPLIVENIPKTWIKALELWNENIVGCKKSLVNITVIQGNNDKTVEWEYNIKLIAEKFPNSKIHIVDEAGHELLNESKSIREEVFKNIGNCFKD